MSDKTSTTFTSEVKSDIKWKYLSKYIKVVLKYSTFHHRSGVKNIYMSINHQINLHNYHFVFKKNTTDVE